jgi:hypothetical protein
MTTTLEQQARKGWASWGIYAKFSVCTDCGRFLYVRARRVSGPWLCLECWDIR